MTYRTLSEATLVLVASGNVLTKTTLGDFLDAHSEVDAEEIATIRASLERGLSHFRRSGSAEPYTLMPR